MRKTFIRLMSANTCVFVHMQLKKGQFLRIYNNCQCAFIFISLFDNIIVKWQSSVLYCSSFSDFSKARAY